MKTTLKLMAALLMLVCATSVFAQGGMRGGMRDGKGDHREGKGMNRDSAFAKISQRLQLTPNQQTKLKEIMKQNRQEMKAIKEANKNADKATRRQAVMAQMKKMDDQVNAILNDSQRAEYEKIKAERREEMKKRKMERKDAKKKALPKDDPNPEDDDETLDGGLL